MAGPYPLATLGPTITSAGITIPSYADVLASLQASFQAIYGSDAYISADSQDGQLLAVFAKAISDQNNQIVAVYQAYAPAYAQGAELSSLVRINGISRLVASYSTAVGTVVGNVGTVITNGVVRDTNGNLWNLPSSVTIPTGGSATITVTCQTLGAVVALSGTINQIFNPQLGWASFVNTSDAALGQPVETDAALRQRQALSVALPALTPLESISGAIAAVPNVTRSFVYENDTAVTDANGVPSHSISVIVEGGDVTAVATAIETLKSPGTGTYGTTSVVVTDPTGLPVTINFFELDNIEIYVNITIKALPNYVATTAAAISTAVAAFINSLAIGGEVYYSQLYPAAQLDSAGVGATFYITALTVGTAPSPTGVVNIPIAFNAAAISDITKVLVTVT
jgi:uncharacterized phage protein gp47/JayE